MLALTDDRVRAAMDEVMMEARATRRRFPTLDVVVDRLTKLGVRMDRPRAALASMLFEVRPADEVNVVRPFNHRPVGPAGHSRPARPARSARSARPPRLPVHRMVGRKPSGRTGRTETSILDAVVIHSADAYQAAAVLRIWIDMSLGHGIDAPRVSTDPECVDVLRRARQSGLEHLFRPGTKFSTRDAAMQQLDGYMKATLANRPVAACAACGNVSREIVSIGGRPICANSLRGSIAPCYARRVKRCAEHDSETAAPAAAGDPGWIDNVLDQLQESVTATLGF